uniref:hypothetical protein n=1 Tax=Litoreibacter roseus TaxID=2601869 RepID=UPI001FAA4CC7|nr:hypothetical protein [Litoreibacter roseus]
MAVYATAAPTINAATAVMRQRKPNANRARKVNGKSNVPMRPRFFFVTRAFRFGARFLAAGFATVREYLLSATKGDFFLPDLVMRLRSNVLVFLSSSIGVSDADVEQIYKKKRS